MKNTRIIEIKSLYILLLLFILLLLSSGTQNKFILLQITGFININLNILYEIYRSRYMHVLKQFKDTSQKTRMKMKDVRFR